MADFEMSWPLIFENEGRTLYSDRETGEVSKFGVTYERLLQYQGVSWSEIERRVATVPFEEKVKYVDENVDEDTAKRVYEKLFWTEYWMGALRSQKVANKVFDMIVNMGPGIGGRLLQVGLNALLPAGFIYMPPVKVDGVVGPKTADAVNLFLTRMQSMKGEDILVWMLEGQSIVHYTGLASKRALKGNTADIKNVGGWVNRAKKQL